MNTRTTPASPDALSAADKIAREIVLDRLADEVASIDVWTRPGLFSMPLDVADYVAAVANEIIARLKSQL